MKRLRSTDSLMSIAPSSAQGEEKETPPLIYKNGSSDSDSSGILNGDASPYDVAPAVFDDAAAGNAKGLGFSFHQLLKAEEYDETCTTCWFSDVKPPTLAWCSDSCNCPRQWQSHFSARCLVGCIYKSTPTS